jgi:integrase
VRRELHRFTALAVSRITKPGMHHDGGGLYLQVTATGAKSWIFRFMLKRHAREMGLGSFPAISLSGARARATECHTIKAQGGDPIQERRAHRGQQLLAQAQSMTFRDCAEAYIAAHKAGWRNAKHAEQWTNTLSTYAYPVMGDLPVQSIDVGLVMKVIESIWKTKTETASRVRGRIESILDWASARGYRSGDNPARWKGHLDNLLPARSKVQKVEHHPALAFEEVAAFIKTLRTQSGVAARALEFVILTTCRTSEAIKAKWAEFDLEKAIWIIPPDRMKSGREHRVPLSKPVLSILKKLRDANEGGDYVFPGAKINGPLSNMALLKVLERMSRDDLTTHGFRSSFRDWAAELTAFPAELAEMALAHVVSDKVEAAYRRGDMFDKRRKLMDAWARYCCTPDAGNVISLGKRNQSQEAKQSR